MMWDWQHMMKAIAIAAGVALLAMLEQALAWPLLSIAVVLYLLKSWPLVWQIVLLAVVTMVLQAWFQRSLPVMMGGVALLHLSYLVARRVLPGSSTAVFVGTTVWALFGAVLLSRFVEIGVWWMCSMCILWAVHSFFGRRARKVRFSSRFEFMVQQ